MRDYVSEIKELLKQTDLNINKSSRYALIKRILDFFLALVGLIVGIPICILFGILIFLESPGNVIFKQERVGKDGKIFILYKLRSMCLDAEKNGQQWAQKNDSRILRVGKFIRKTRIDEIPQLFNILKGDMTFVGPRPEIPKFTVEFNEHYPGFINRVVVLPGLTGLAQIKGGYDLNPKEKLEKDLEYIQNQSLLLDLKIIFNTVTIIFTGAGAR